MIEVSEQLEEAESLRIENLISFVTSVAKLNGIEVRRITGQLPQNCISINGKQHQVKNFLDENGFYPSNK